MKKKVIIALVVIILICVVIGVLVYLNTGASKYYEKLNIKDENKLMAIIYIGGNEDSYDYNIVNKYFGEKSNVPVVEAGGSEKYLIIPKYKSFDVKVYSLDLTDEGEVTQKLLQKVTGPFYLTCNSSDIFANSLIKISTRGDEHNYSPFISLKDGSLEVEDFVIEIEK